MTKALFVLAIFVSAFLLFLVQPLYARMILPYLGGSPSVWNTALVFYQSVLLAGYAYAHWASKNLIGNKVWIHVALMCLAFVFLPLRLPGGLQPATTGTPVFWLLGVMFIGVGLPFFFVSSGSPLLQRWFSQVGHKQSDNPYFLYTASNVGSLASLLGYPIFFELNLRLPDQSLVWTIGYGLLVVLVALCAFRFKSAVVRQDIAEVSPVVPLERNRKIRWLLLAFVPSSLLMGITTYVSTEIAAVPLLWVIPLAIYLITFIIAFAEKQWIPLRWIRVITPFFLVLPLIVTIGHLRQPWWIPVCGGFLGFLFASWMCHGELAEDKPEPRQLTEFFMWVSLGGVLGGLFCGLVAPLIFTQVWEYPIALVVCAALLKGSEKPAKLPGWCVPAATVVACAGSLLALKQMGDWYESSAWKAMIVPACVCILASFRPKSLALSIGVLVGAFLLFAPGVNANNYQSRGFFGTLVVRTRPDTRILMHGTTLHGEQPLDEPFKSEPSSYYHKAGPCGDIFMKRDLPLNATIGLVGLGAGTLLSYSEPGQDWTIFEIDPDVVKVSSNPKYFTYLPNAKGKWHVELGDARLSLQKPGPKFDLMIFDAYSSDAVPIHLITKEAFEAYLTRLKPGGIIAVHISNRYMDLWPVFSTIAHDLGMVERRRYDSGGDFMFLRYKSASDWLVMARTTKDLDGLSELEYWVEDPAPPNFKTWTDDRSSILTVLKKSPWKQF